MVVSEPGLDYAFLQFIGATPESQKHWQRFYVSMFAGCRDVLDLGCGTGDFLEMLVERGIQVHGVDLDPQCCADARSRGLPVVCGDVLQYLRDAPPEQFDGVFCAHLVEHLPYEAVLEVVRGCLRVLRPGGRVVLVTPNASSLFAHLEMYYRHFGHVSFYHPELLRFFLDHAGFTDISTGTNPTMGTGATWDRRLREDVRDAFLYDRKLSSPERVYPPPVPVAAPRSIATRPARPRPEPPGSVPSANPAMPGDPALSEVTIPPISFSRRMPVFVPGLPGRLVRWIKQTMATWLVLPYVDEIAASANARAAAQERILRESVLPRIEALSAVVTQTNTALAETNRALTETNRALAETDRALAETDEALHVTTGAVNATAVDLAIGLHHVNVGLAEASRGLDGLYHQFSLVEGQLHGVGDAAELAAERLVGALERMDPPWECYAMAVKAGGEHDQTA